MAEQIGSKQDAVELATEDEVTESAEMQQDLGKEPKAGTHLDHRQMKLLAALVCNPDIQLACKATDVGRTTAYRWLQQPAFQEELSRQRDAVLSEALAGVKTLAARAVAELAGLLGATDDRLRRQACNDILAHALRFREMENLERRLAVVEKQMKHKKGGRNS